MSLVPGTLPLALLAALATFAQGEGPKIQAEPTPTAVESAGSIAAATAETARPAAPKAVRRGNWLIEETENFSICRPVHYRYDPSTGAALEKARAELKQAWLPATAAAAWSPKCQIVLHATPAGYLQAVGRGGQATTGSALVDFDKDRITTRKIDIRGDRPDWFTAALTHELTHVVLADRFISVAIPHWADEGMAILADTPDKRDRHAVDLRDAIDSGAEFRLAELLTLGGYPHPGRMGAFYGQSASLVDYLTRIGGREQLVAMVERATSHGYDVALREIYAIESVRHLERDWRKHLAEPKPAAANRAAAEKTAATRPASGLKPPATTAVAGAAAME